MTRKTSRNSTQITVLKSEVIPKSDILRHRLSPYRGVSHYHPSAEMTNSCFFDSYSDAHEVRLSLYAHAFPCVSIRARASEPLDRATTNVPKGAESKCIHSCGLKRNPFPETEHDSFGCGRLLRQPAAPRYSLRLLSCCLSEWISLR